MKVTIHFNFFKVIDIESNSKVRILPISLFFTEKSQQHGSLRSSRKSTIYSIMTNPPKMQSQKDGTL